MKSNLTTRLEWYRFRVLAKAWRYVHGIKTTPCLVSFDDLIDDLAFYQLDVEFHSPQGRQNYHICNFWGESSTKQLASIVREAILHRIPLHASLLEHLRLELLQEENIVYGHYLCSSTIYHLFCIARTLILVENHSKQAETLICMMISLDCDEPCVMAR